MVLLISAGTEYYNPSSFCTFWESVGIAVDLQGIQGADLQVRVIVKELLQDWLEGE